MALLPKPNHTAPHGPGNAAAFLPPQTGLSKIGTATSTKPPHWPGASAAALAAADALLAKLAEARHPVTASLGTSKTRPPDTRIVVTLTEVVDRSTLPHPTVAPPAPQAPAAVPAAIASTSAAVSPSAPQVSAFDKAFAAALIHAGRDARVKELRSRYVASHLQNASSIDIAKHRAAYQQTFHGIARATAMARLKPAMKQPGDSAAMRGQVIASLTALQQAGAALIAKRGNNTAAASSAQRYAPLHPATKPVTTQGQPAMTAPLNGTSGVHAAAPLKAIFSAPVQRSTIRPVLAFAARLGAQSLQVGAKGFAALTKKVHAQAMASHRSASAHGNKSLVTGALFQVEHGLIAGARRMTAGAETLRHYAEPAMAPAAAKIGSADNHARVPQHHVAFTPH